MKASKVQIVVGGQYGSEAKGAIAAYLCQRENIDVAVRTGATNAGHTVVYGGMAVKMQQLPVGFVNPNTVLVIGAGALVDLSILRREIEMLGTLTGRDVRERLFIDYRAAIHHPAHAERSKMVNRHHLIGATGKGCSEALMDRIRLRGHAEPVILKDVLGLDNEFALVDTERLLNKRYDQGASIQLEATQGQLLDLCLGPYPYVTHKQTGPAQWMTEAGLSPALRTDIVMVLRTYPIRVAGNSGPMAHETCWPQLARSINSKLTRHGRPPLVAEWALQEFEANVREVRPTFDCPRWSTGLDLHTWSADERLTYREALSEINAAALARLPADTLVELSKLLELTTVTKKLRRVGELSTIETATAARQIRPHRIALTFMNYLHPELWHESSPATDDEQRFIRYIETMAEAPVTLINRGPNPEHIVDVVG